MKRILKKHGFAIFVRRKYKEDEEGVRDHCHITGKYRGSAHNACNLQFKISDEKLKIPIVFHNLRGYDGHHIIREIGEIIKEENEKIERENEIINRENEQLYKKHSKEEYEKIKKPNIPKLYINIIPKNNEKYMSFSLGKHLTFIDSIQFLIFSLADLAKNQERDSLNYVKEYFTKEEEFELMIRKGVYPYSYMDSFQEFNETNLPNKTDFYNDLEDKEINDKDYEHAQKVWNTFNLRNMGEYHDLYLKADVLLLTDIFENFRKTCLTYYELDPAHYLSSPSLAWDAALKMTEVYLEKITDMDMLLFIESAKRGGICFISHRQAKANNKFMDNYNHNEKNSHIMYLDANNLYGWAMSKPLPYSGFRWVNNFPETEMMPKKEGIGRFYEVDLEYPKEIHDLHNDYPCAPEKKKIICCQTIVLK